MTDRERILTAALRSVGKSIDAYLARIQRAEPTVPLGSAFLVLDAIREDVRRALDEAGDLKP